MTWTAFFTPLYIRRESALLKSLASLRLLLLGIFISTSSSALADAFTIRSVETSLEEKVYTLGAEIEYQFSEPALEALQNGVPLIVLVDIKVEKERNWWLNKTVADLQQGYLLLYHALTEKYIVNNLNSGAQENYDSLGAATHALGRIKALPILDAKLANKGGKYLIRIHTYLDLEALPAPMRPMAYISSDWRLESDWYEWPLQP